LQQATTEAATDIQEQAVKVFRAFPGRFSGQSEAEAIAEISSGLAAQRTVERKKELVAKANVTVERKLQPYRVAIVPVEAATLGEASAPVEIVEFSDFQCPYCARASSTVKQVLERYAGRVRLTFRHYPLTVIHKDAAKAAEAASCAGDQKRFWEMHDRLFANPQALRVTDLKKAAADLGLDSAKFDACLENGQHTSTWKRDLRAGQDYGVGGTPTFFINGRLVPGSPTVEAFAVLIEQELALNPAAASGPSMR
jgi:protein-disulfide isomerase